jgi:hypothetical protein
MTWGQTGVVSVDLGAHSNVFVGTTLLFSAGQVVKGLTFKERQADVRTASWRATVRGPALYIKSVKYGNCDPAVE